MLVALIGGTGESNSMGSSLKSCEGSPQQLPYAFQHLPSLYTDKSKSWTNCYGKILYERFSDYSSFEGEWKNGKLHGWGRVIAGDKKWEGQWLNGKLQPKQKNTIPSEPSALRTVFTTLSKHERKLIQSNLAHLNYYTSSIDALYGKGTEAALKAYNKEYLGNADLGEANNVTILMDDLLNIKSAEIKVMTPSEIATEQKKDSEPPYSKSLETEETAETKVLAPNETVPSETKLAAPTPPLNFTQIKASYDVGDYSRAFADAQLLAVMGNVEAQLLLGNMFADGKGTIQINTAAHMWFNIATMNGHDEAYEKRKAIAALMTPNAVEEAQKMAMVCIQSNFKDCGLLLKTSQSDDHDPNTFFGEDLLKDNYAQQTLLKRKQLQYALRELGFYASVIDGIWGAKTEAAFTNYQRSKVVEADRPIDLFELVLSDVTVPNAFANSPPSNNTIGKNSSESADMLADSIDRMTKELEYQGGMRQLDNAQRILNSMMPRTYPIINCNTFGNLTTCY